MTSITLRIPVDVVDSMKEIAPLKCWMPLRGIRLRCNLNYGVTELSLARS